MSIEYSGKKQAVVVGVKDEKALNEIIALEQSKQHVLRVVYLYKGVTCVNLFILYEIMLKFSFRFFS